MKKSEWSDKQIEELLRTMPKIEDHRHHRDIYQNVMVKMKRKHQRSWIFPALATAAAITIFFVLSTDLLNTNQSADSMKESYDAGSEVQIQMTENSKLTKNEIEKETASMDQSEAEKAQKSNTSDNSNESQETIAEDESKEENESDEYSITNANAVATTAVYEEDVSGRDVLIFPIPDQRTQIIVPVSVIVSKSDDETRIRQYKDVMKQIEEENWGLSDYYPLNATLTLDEESKVLNVDLPKDHQYGVSSTTETVFTKVINETLTMLGLEKVTFSTEGMPGIEFAHTGIIKEQTAHEMSQHAYYVFYPNNNLAKPYLVPSKEAFQTIEEALKQMHENRDDLGLKASIPSNLHVNVVSKTNHLLTLSMENSSKINNELSLVQTIEAILLTAKEFNFERVKIESTDIKKIGNFQFNEEWNVPVAPNKQIIK